jgi:hypothetical protein
MAVCSFVRASVSRISKRLNKRRTELWWKNSLASPPGQEVGQRQIVTGARTTFRCEAVQIFQVYAGPGFTSRRASGADGNVHRHKVSGHSASRSRSPGRFQLTLL